MKEQLDELRPYWVTGLEGNPLATFESEGARDKWVLMQVKENKLMLGEFVYSDKDDRKGKSPVC